MRVFMLMLLNWRQRILVEFILNLCLEITTTTRDSLTYQKVNMSSFYFSYYLLSIGMQIPAKLKYVNIFFDTPTFDKITKDKSAKVSEVNIKQIFI